MQVLGNILNIGEVDKVPVSWDNTTVAFGLTLVGMFLFLVLLLVMQERTRRYKRFAYSKFGEEELQSHVVLDGEIMIV